MDQINCISRKRDESHPFILVDHIFYCVYHKNIRAGREIAFSAMMKPLTKR
jgi:hypothetical protein